MLVEPLYGVYVGKAEEWPGGGYEVWVERFDEGGRGWVGEEDGDGVADLKKTG